MEPLRLLHIADAHLDTPFYGREESLRRKLRDACRQAFSRAVEEAIERDVHALLIAGDLFDDDRLSFTTERFLLEAMGRLKEAGVAVFYATGNHDPGRAGYRAHQLGWPDNVHLFTTAQPETVAITDRHGTQLGWLTAAGHSSRREEKNLAARYGQARNELPHVALLHAQVISARGAEYHDRYAPCTEEDLSASGFDYWALGHIHMQQRVSCNLPAWYAGNLQGRNPRETGPKGALYVEVAKGAAVQPEFMSLAPVTWDWIQLPCPSEARAFESLVGDLAASLRGSVNLADEREHLVRVDLTGESLLAAELCEVENLLELTEKLRGQTEVGWLEIRPKSVVRPVDLEEYRGSATVLGEAIDLLQELEMEDELLDRLRPGDLARTDMPDVRRYLRDLLTGLDRELAALLVPEKQR